MADLIDRQAAIKAIEDLPNCYNGFSDTYDKSCIIGVLEELPSAQTEIVRCKDCEYGYLYMDVQNGVTDSWIECRNPEGLNRDVSVDGYCSASIRREEEK